VRDSSDLVIDHRSISKEHARLTRLTDGTWQVLDLGSANGIKVNGEPYSKSELRSGERLELGHVTLRCLAAGAKAPAAGGGGTSSGPSKGTWVMIGGLVAVLAIAAVVVVLMLGKGDKPAGGDANDKTASKTGSDKPGADKVAAKAPDESPSENKAEAKGEEKPSTEPAKEEPKAKPSKESADGGGLMEAVEAKLAEGKYEQALPMLEAAKLQNPGSAPIAAKYAEVSRLVELKKDLDKAEKKLDTDPAMALELATDVRGKAPKGTPLYDGADSIVDMAKKKLSSKVAAPAKVDKPKEDKPKEDKPKEVKPKEDKPKEVAAPEGKSSKDLYDDAREALGAGDYDRSIGSAKQALKAGYKKALTVLAKAYWGKGDKSSCLSYAQKAIDAGFDDASMQNLVNKCQ